MDLQKQEFVKCFSFIIKTYSCYLVIYISHTQSTVVYVQSFSAYAPMVHGSSASLKAAATEFTRHLHLL